MKVLVTGGSGQVGSEVARELHGRAEVEAFDRATLDIADPAAIAARIRDVRPDVVVNAAAYTAVDRAEDDESGARAVNAIAPGVIAEEAKRIGAFVVHYSTDYVFDGRAARPYVETDAVNPLGVYGRTKLEGERAIAASGVPHVILRTSWVYAPRGKNFLLTMLRLAGEREELRIVDDQRGAPTTSRQIARATIEIVLAKLDRAREAPGVYHATASGETTWFGFAGAIFERARLPKTPRLVPIATKDFGAKAARPANSVMSNARLAETFGLALGSWTEGLDEVMRSGQFSSEK
jgi:dTDP-4-dehydrorhamnose reductase